MNTNILVLLSKLFRFRKPLSILSKLIQHKKTIFTVLSSLAVSAPAMATDKDIVMIIMSLASQVFNVGNLVVLIAMLGGFACLIMIPVTVLGQDEPHKNPLNAIPYYFIGAGIGLGVGFSSDMVQATIFGENTDHTLERAFTPTDGAFGGESQTPQ